MTIYSNEQGFTFTVNKDKTHTDYTLASLKSLLFSENPIIKYFLSDFSHKIFCRVRIYYKVVLKARDHEVKKRITVVTYLYVL